jgi:RNA polymerase sigma-70 factor (ECF subfamily)
MSAVPKRRDPATPDAALIGGVALGGHAPFAELVRRYHARFFAVARRMLGNDADAEDAVQSAFLRIFRGAGSYREQWSGSTWLYRVLTNVCIDQSRKRRSHEPLSAESETIAPPRSRGERIDVDRALARLPAEARAILLLCYVEELPYAEIARVRGISVNTVKTQLLRAKRLMRRFLSEVTP